MVAQKTDKPVTTTRARRGRPPKGRERWWVEPFLQAYARLGVILSACEEVGCSRQTVTALRQSDPAFEKRFLEAYDASGDVLEREAWRRAVEGVEKPVNVGKQVVTVREYSDTLLKMLLAGRRPQYRNNPQVEVNVSQHQHVDVDAVELEEASLEEVASVYDTLTKSLEN